MSKDNERNVIEQAPAERAALGQNLQRLTEQMIEQDAVKYRATYASINLEKMFAESQKKSSRQFWITLVVSSLTFLVAFATLMIAIFL